MTERIEIFDPNKLNDDPDGDGRPSYTLEYGVPLDTIKYVSEGIYLPSYRQRVRLVPIRGGNEFAAFISAMDRVEELVVAEGSAAFVISRPCPVLDEDSPGYEFVVFRAISGNKSK